MTDLIMEFINGDAWNSAFWATPGGIFILSAIFVGSCANVFAHWINDGPIDRIYYSLCAISCLATLLNIREGVVPYNVVKTLLFLMACRFLIRFVSQLHMYMRIRQLAKITWNRH